jgi:hypothetical protein
VAGEVDISARGHIVGTDDSNGEPDIQRLWLDGEVGHQSRSISHPDSGTLFESTSSRPLPINDFPVG